MKMITPRRILVVVALALASLLALPATASAESDSSSDLYTCPHGYVCLFPSNPWQRPVLVPEGKSASFIPALSVTRLTNNTWTDYCIGGNFSFGLPAGRDVSFTKPILVSSVEPGDICLNNAQESELVGSR